MSCYLRKCATLVDRWNLLHKIINSLHIKDFYFFVWLYIIYIILFYQPRTKFLEIREKNRRDTPPKPCGHPTNCRQGPFFASALLHVHRFCLKMRNGPWQELAEAKLGPPTIQLKLKIKSKSLVFKWVSSIKVILNSSTKKKIGHTDVTRKSQPIILQVCFLKYKNFLKTADKLKKIKSFLIILSVQSFLFHNPVICCLFSSVCSVTIESE